MTVVIYASVVIKWLLQDPEREAHTDKATDLMKAVVTGEQAVLQPMHSSSSSICSTLSTTR